MTSKFVEVDAFSVADDAGRTYSLRVYAEHTNAEPALGLPSQWEPTGLMRYRLPDGESVDVLPNGTFCAVRTGRRLRRITHLT